MTQSTVAMLDYWDIVRPAAEFRTHPPADGACLQPPEDHGSLGWRHRAPHAPEGRELKHQGLGGRIASQGSPQKKMKDFVGIKHENMENP